LQHVLRTGIAYMYAIQVRACKHHFMHRPYNSSGTVILPKTIHSLYYVFVADSMGQASTILTNWPSELPNSVK